ncbi:MAG: hypothetical protein OXU94_04215 [Gammaproteobacteria bacterium]|nr:hypothetical protein [Gammaproteobacteria bacterium]
MTDEIKTEDARNVLAENTAQTVRKHLMALERNRQVMQTRWIWELLQNARDARARMASIECNKKEVVFRHNGDKFNKDEIAHLIYHGSTKTEDEETIGQYGSGFLTTHLLSSAIHVSGRVDTGKFFNFPLKREVGSVESLKQLMEYARGKFNQSLSNKSTIPGGFTTEFRYLIQDDRGDVARDGIEMLKRCAPWVLAFNQFSSIEIKSPDTTVKYKVGRNPRTDGLQEITTSVLENGSKQKEFILMVAEDEDRKTSIAIPIQKKSDSNGRYMTCDVDCIPKLFLGFPLVNTEDFSFPAVINGFQFTPTEDRDGVNLATGRGEEANEKNQQSIETAWNLLINLLKSVAARGYHGIYKLADIAPVPQHKWLNPEWLQKVIERFVTEIRKTPTVVVGAGNPVSPEEAILPIAKTTECVETLWCLLGYMQENSARLPEKEEAVGWCNAIKSWMTVPGQHSDIGFNCQKLAEEIDKKVVENKNAGQIKAIESVLRLKHGVNAIKWLSCFHALIEQEGLRNETADCRIVPAQDGQLRKLSELHRDEGVAEELKDTAELLGWHIREELRHGEITSLNEESGAGNQDNKSVVKTLIDELRTRSDGNMDDAFAKASVGVFKWIAEQENWDFLRDFPAFAIKDGDDKQRQLITLRRHQQGSEESLYLAPIRSWPGDLQPYSELFPKSRILDDSFFGVSPDPDVWKALDKERFVKNGVIIKKDSHPVPNSRPEDGKNHRPEESITVTTVAFLKGESGIRSKIRGSKRLARLFWRFLTEWLLKNEPLESKSAKCADCGEEHCYPLADWLEPVKENKWVPVEKGQERANAESLGNLLQGEPEADSLNSERATTLLREIGVRDPDTLRFTSANPRDQKTVLGWLDNAKNNEKLQDRMEKVMGAAQKVRQCQDLGKQVEDLVKKSLESAGFAVSNTGVGSDFEIAAEIGAVAALKLTHPRENQTWLVEVKATSDNAGVKMTLTQAKEARDKGNKYLLCVVPLDGNEPEKDTVREKMRFVQNIGVRVAKLCKDFDDLDQWRKEITAEESQGFQLTISSGEGRILVKKSVWERGFPLDELAKKLKS